MPCYRKKTGLHLKRSVRNGEEEDEGEGEASARLFVYYVIPVRQAAHCCLTGTIS